MIVARRPHMREPVVDELQHHLGLCQEVLTLAQQDSQSLQDPAVSSCGAVQLRKELLARLNESVEALRARRRYWQQESAAERALPEVVALLRQNQDVIMKILLLDRDNEQRLLRRGLVPSRHLPPAARQRPHFVADLYRRNGLASAHAD